MSNERLRATMQSVGLSPQQVSERLGVDPKTVERWISNGRVPHRAHRLAVSTLLGKDDVFLWPSTATDARATSASQAEFVSLYPTRGSVPAATWVSLLENAKESIDLLAFAASFLHDTIDGFASLVTAKARAGVRVRLLFGDPDSDAVRVRGAEEGIGDLLAARCRLTWAYLEPLVGPPGVEARMHGCTLYSSIFRFDDTLFANTHSYGTPASHSPLIHYQRIPGGRLFDNNLASFERTWATGTIREPLAGTSPTD